MSEINQNEQYAQSETNKNKHRRRSYLVLKNDVELAEKISGILGVGLIALAVLAAVFGHKDTAIWLIAGEIGAGATFLFVCVWQVR